jgi:hypothetical protein
MQPALGVLAIKSKGIRIMKKSIQLLFFVFVVLAVSLSGCASTSIQQPWVVVESIVTKEENPIAQQNVSDQWEGALLAENLKFAGPFEMKLMMESIGENLINLTSTEGAGEDWWKGTKRMEISCTDGNLGVYLRDGSSEAYIYQEKLDMPGSDVETSCQITVKFDQYARNIQFFQDDKAILQFTSAEVGDFQEGLFPDGKILKVDLSSPPHAGNSTSGAKFSSVKLVELVFSVPPGE